MKYIITAGSIVLVLVFISSCAVIPKYTHSNKQIDPEKSADRMFKETAKASEAVPWKLSPTCRNTAESDPAGKCEENNNDFIGIAISGGGTRSAVFSAAVLFELQKYGLLQKADVMTCVSGGCITAAYYALSCDPMDGICLPTEKGEKRPEWNEEEVFEKLTRNYQLRWIGNWFWPDNIARYWFTHYDRTDIMAETLSDNFYDTSLLGGEPFEFKDLNKQRPNILISATNSTNRPQSPENFLFSREQFSTLNSDLGRFRIANAVMASATFPGAFQYVTLRDFSNIPDDDNPGDTYIHLFDGGTLDNLGLTALKQVVKKSVSPQESEKVLPARSIIISIDAFPLFKGTNPKDPDPRGFFDFIVDSNFLDAFDALLASTRDLVVAGHTDITRLMAIDMDNEEELLNHHFMHITFTDLKSHSNYTGLLDTITKIGTNFSVTPEQGECLRFAAHLLVENKIRKLSDTDKFNDLLIKTPDTHHPDTNKELVQDNPCNQNNHQEIGNHTTAS